MGRWISIQVMFTLPYNPGAIYLAELELNQQQQQHLSKNFKLQDRKFPTEKAEFFKNIIASMDLHLNLSSFHLDYDRSEL